MSGSTRSTSQIFLFRILLPPFESESEDILWAMNNLDDKLCSQAFRVDPFGKNLEKIPKNRSRDFLHDRTSTMVVLARNWISTTSIGLWDDLTFMQTEHTSELQS